MQNERLLSREYEIARENASIPMQGIRYRATKKGVISIETTIPRVAVNIGINISKVE
jgi:hypothetical protein